VARVLPALVIAACTLTLAACGSGGGPSVGARSQAVDQAPARVAAQAVVRDVTILGKVRRAGATDHVLVALFSLVNGARSLPNDREGWKGQALVRSHLPRIVHSYSAAYSQTRDELTRLQMSTPAGRALRSWLLDTYESQRRQLSELESKIEAGGYAWAAVLRWSEEDATARARSDNRLNSIVRRLPVAQRDAVARAITQYLG
jgi:hypothetical protein